MRRNVLLSILFMYIFLFLLNGISQAVSVSSSPAPSSAGHTVTATVNATFPVPSANCLGQINFGDSTPGWEGLSPPWNIGVQGFYIRNNDHISSRNSDDYRILRMLSTNIKFAI